MYLSPKALISGLGLAVYAGLVIWISSALGLSGSKRWLFAVALIAIGLMAVGVIWLIRLKKAKPKAADEGAQAQSAGAGLAEIDYLVGRAESKLKSAKHGRIGTLPALLLVGEAGSGKTSVARYCGLNPDHLAGQVLQGETVAPTDSINLWFARRAILVEAAESVLGDPGRWARLVRRVAPTRLGSVFGGGRQAPRALVVCFDCESFKTASKDAITARAQSLQSRLREASEILGISLPVYVFFTHADSLPFFAEYVAGLKDPEAEQVLGVTLPVQDYRTGLYVQDQTNRLNAAFDGVFKSLDEHRADYLAREQDPERLPGIYEFPREFHKLQPRLVPLMVELCRPSQLAAGPFLRGFYFTGVRMVLEEASPQIGKSSGPASPAAEPSTVNATQVFDARQWQASPSTGMRREATLTGATKIFSGGLTTMLPAGTIAQPEQARWVPQWCFLSHLIGDLVLQDHSALGASGSSSKVSFWRRALLATAVALFLVCVIGFTVSFIENESLAGQVSSVEADSEQLLRTATRGQAPTPGQFQTLNSAGQLLGTLVADNRAKPLDLRWGLFSVPGLLKRTCNAYGSDFDLLLLGPAQDSIRRNLSQLTYHNSQADPYDAPYNMLKAYLITTHDADGTGDAEHVKDDPAFLPGELATVWQGAVSATGDQQARASEQFVLYSKELADSSAAGDDTSCLTQSRDAETVKNGRAYLTQFPPEQPAYRAVLAEDIKTNPQIFDFNAKYQDSYKNVVASYKVGGAFTPAGWSWIHGADMDRYVKGETWVLGPNTRGGDVSTVKERVFALYEQDYVSQWRQFLDHSSVVNSGSASARLEDLADANSPLLMLFCSAAQNIHPDMGSVPKLFAPVIFVVPNSVNCATLKNDANKGYTDALRTEGDCLKDLPGTPTDQKDAAQQKCSAASKDARSAAEKLAGDGKAPGSDPEVASQVRKLLLAPLAPADDVIAKSGSAPPGGAEACKALSTLTARPRGSLTGDDVKLFFGPGGTVANLKQPNDKSTPGYKKFYDKVMKIRQTLSAADGSLAINYSVTAKPPEQGTFVLTIGGQSMSKADAPSKFVWTGSKDSVKLDANKNAPITDADIFAFVAREANPSGTLSDNKFTVKIPVGTGNIDEQPRLTLTIDAGEASMLFDPGWPGKLNCKP